MIYPLKTLVKVNKYLIKFVTCNDYNMYVINSKARICGNCVVIFCCGYSVAYLLHPAGSAEVLINTARNIFKYDNYLQNSLNTYESNTEEKHRETDN